jgi:hypothetical protein
LQIEAAIVAPRYAYFVLHVVHAEVAVVVLRVDVVLTVTATPPLVPMGLLVGAIAVVVVLVPMLVVFVPGIGTGATGLGAVYVDADGVHG